jgi:hypothetical protein
MPVLDRVTTDVAFSNSAAENTYYSFTTPANMGANAGYLLDLQLMFTVLNNSGANRTYTIRTKFGGTTYIADALIAVPTSTALRTMNIRVRVANDGTTTTQYIDTTVTVSAPLAVTTGLAGDFGTVPLISEATVSNTGAITQTNSAVLALSVQADAATSSQTITLRYALLQLI